VESRCDRLAERIVALLNARGRNLGWCITAVSELQHQSYHIGTEPEALRSVEDAFCLVEVYHRHETSEGPGVGVSRFHVPASEEEDEVARCVETAVLAARLNRNRAWPLPGTGLVYPAVEAFERREADDPRAALEEAAAEIRRAAEPERDVEVSHFEIVLYDRTVRLRNSAGINLDGRTTLAVLHMVLVAGGSGRRFDIKREIIRRRIRDFDLTRTVGEASAFARDMLNARLPSSGTLPVVISHAGLDYLFDPVLSHAGAEFQFEGITRFRKGESVLPGAPGGDRLTLTSDGLLPMGTETNPFSSEGLPPASVPILKDNVFLGPWATAEFAEAVGVSPTGPVTNLRVEPGSTPQEEMVSPGPLLWVVEFSALLPDKVSGDFTGEIRLAYEIREGRRRPVKGGAVSGNLFDAMGRMTLSRETVFRGNYLGPAAVRFEDLTVSGA
jgi:PmbA protein